MRALLAVALFSLGGAAQGVVGGDLLFDLAPGAARAGMGGVGIAVPSPDSLHLNPAGLPWLAGVQIVSTYGN
ncbi:MAG: hypothetical protein N2320_05510, partial [Candidatus Bipolaricaulota bacterium]|nr:hypothetical protein [Candidatus Bipolaricaulota bacterium]